jgi:ketosteroid isomerase-like protein
MGAQQNAQLVKDAYVAYGRGDAGIRAREFIAQGNKVVVLGHGAWTVNDTGRDFDSDWVHVFTIEDGHIAAFREFLDSHLAAEACQANA